MSKGQIQSAFTIMITVLAAGAIVIILPSEAWAASDPTLGGMNHFWFNMYLELHYYRWISWSTRTTRSSGLSRS